MYTKDREVQMELDDMQEEFDRERDDMLARLRELTMQLRLKEMVLDIIYLIYIYYIYR